MRKDFGKNPWFYPLPVLIIGTYGKDGKADAMNAAWGSLYDRDHMILCLSAGHKTTKNIREKGAFTVSFATVPNLILSDYVGLVSANDTDDKIEKAGWHTTRSQFVDAPLIDELPLALECRLTRVNEDGNIIGEIVNISADESVLDADGNIDPALLRIISFDPVQNVYRELGSAVGHAFSDGAALK